MFFDPLYLIIFAASLALSGLAQFFVRRAWSSWSRVPNGSGLSGLEAGVAIVRRTRLGDRRPLGTEGQPAIPGIQVEALRFSWAGGILSDHYDPRSHTVHLSREVAETPSVAALAIVAHELGHAEQRESSSPLLALRGFLVPAIRFSPTLAYVAVLAGLFFNLSGLLWLGVWFYAAMVVFVLLDLPVEIDASRRALRLLSSAGLIRSEEDEVGTRRMLAAAASTYLAAALTSVLELFYYVALARRKD